MLLNKAIIFIKSTISRIKNFFVNFIPNFKKFFIVSKIWSLKIGSFLILLNSYLLMKAIYKITNLKIFPNNIKNKIIPSFEKIYFYIVRVNNSKVGAINRINLIEISLKNLQAKKNRTFITIGGMAVGIATIVFLVSLGYGLQRMVTSRVARLEEMRQAEITSQAGSNLRITDQAISTLKEFQEVDKLLPMIALVGKVNYKNSVTDTAVFGVTTEYLKESAIKPSRGNIFDSNDISYNYRDKESGEVAGVSIVKAQFGEKIRDVMYSIPLDEWLEVREGPSEESKLLGYTRRVEGQKTATEVWGKSYGDGDSIYESQNSLKLSKWLNAKVYLWELSDRQYSKVINIYGTQDQQTGYLKTDGLEITSFTVTKSQVLGVSTDVEETTSSDAVLNVLEEGDGWVSIEGLTQGSVEENIVEVPLGEKAKLETVVNRAFLRLIGVDEDNAIGQKFEVSFIVPSSLIDAQGEKMQSEAAEYTIVGVIPSEDTPYFYVPFIDIKTLGVNNYSQIKMVVKDKDSLSLARKKVEAMGYTTSSAADTVAQIDSLFNTLRKVLGLIGAVALSVAALGMFNTLTVSLLERIREIGLMKAMGMKSEEVAELFLTESMVMGFFGGVVGLILGFIAGKLLGMVLSLVALFKGVGMIDISYIPPAFVFLIIFLSLMVGLLTGIYPSRRAKKISALNALRYE